MTSSFAKSDKSVGSSVVCARPQQLTLHKLRYTREQQEQRSVVCGFDRIKESVTTGETITQPYVCHLITSFINMRSIIGKYVKNYVLSTQTCGSTASVSAALVHSDDSVLICYYLCNQSDSICLNSDREEQTGIIINIWSDNRSIPEIKHTLAFRGWDHGKASEKFSDFNSVIKINKKKKNSWIHLQHNWKHNGNKLKFTFYLLKMLHALFFAKTDLQEYLFIFEIPHTVF